MLTLKKDFLETIEKCYWLEKCGTSDNIIDLDVIHTNNIKEVKKSINSLKWENFCLNIQNDFTEYLFFNHPDLYHKIWNSAVCDIKEKYLNNDLNLDFNCIMNMFGNEEIAKRVLDDIKFNVLTIYMSNYYSDYYHDELIDKMYKIYLAGHLPCGWVGSLKDGTFLVY